MVLAVDDILPVMINKTREDTPALHRDYPIPRRSCASQGNVVSLCHDVIAQFNTRHADIAGTKCDSESMPYSCVHHCGDKIADALLCR